MTPRDDKSNPAPESTAPANRWWNPLAWPLYARVILGVLIGGSIGAAFGQREIILGWTTAHLGVIAGLYIQLLTALATPLIFFAIVDAFIQTHISGRQGMKMVLICGTNVAVAFLIGLTILNVWQPGASWKGSLRETAAEWPKSAAAGPSQPGGQNTSPIQPGPAPPPQAEPSLSPLAMLKSYIPKSIAQPISENMVLTTAALAILIGAALRSLRRAPYESAELTQALDTFGRLITACYLIVLKILGWLIELAPFAICLAVAGVIGGTEDLAKLSQFVGVFFLTVMASLGLHALVYYPLSAWLIGGKSPRTFFSEGAGAILTGFSLNSSLATAPLTLNALSRMQVSDSSARLSACVGTNFNNDGITLYEAITALFIAQAAGMELHLVQQISILLAALAGSMGIAGIPNSGLIILTLVLKAAHLPDDVIALALPIVYSIDFINARVRSAVNVMGDMQVAILLDAGTKPAASDAPANGVGP
jgi:Na+/H+-dicarboxylate symporter